MQLSLRTDRRLIRAGARSTRYLLVNIVAPAAPPRAGRLPVNVGLALDRSGSMAGERKFDLARDAVEHSLAMLHPEDRFTLVVFDTEIDVLVSATFATPEAKRLARARLREVEPRGGTDLHGGWVAGAAELARVLSGESVNRALLLTDGQANHGVVDPASLAMQAAEFRRCGIATSTFGVGEDFDERLLRDVAHEGGGNFYYIESPVQIPDLLTSELGEALEIVARDAVLRVVVPGGARVEPLNRNRFVQEGRELRVELGDLSSGQELAMVLRVELPRGAEGSVARVEVEVGYREASGRREVARVEWHHAGHVENDAQPRDRVVDRAVAALYAARARAEATEANRDGDLRRARRTLERTAQRICGYAGDDAALTALWRELLAEVEHFSERTMTAMELKSAFFVAESTARNRDPEGKARRGGTGVGPVLDRSKLP